MTRLVSIFFFLFVLCGASASADEAAIQKAYQDYVAALEAGQERQAMRFAKDAYDRAEAYWGDGNVSTGRLAANYADILRERGAFRRAAPIYQRCVEILDQYPDEQESEGRCTIYLAVVKINLGESEEAEALLIALLDEVESLADENEWAAKTAGDAYYVLAQNIKILPGRIGPRGTIFSGGTGTRIASTPAETVEPANGRPYAERAVAYYERVFTETSQALIDAYSLAGQYAEDDDDVAAAEGYYQRAYDALVKKKGVEDQATRSMKGRLAYAQLYRYSKDDGRQTRAPSNDTCRVVWRGDLEIETCIDFRAPPFFPKKVFYDSLLQPGEKAFALIQYDVALNGEIEDARVVFSWPGGLFDERALQAVKGWRYTPPIDQYGNNVRLPDMQTQITYQFRR